MQNRGASQAAELQPSAARSARQDPKLDTSKTPEGGYYIRSLDGIRAVSVSIVFLSHMDLWRIFPGMFGVNAFFLLSGFLITTLMIREHAARGRVSIKDFYFRRVLRIFPPMYIVIGLGVGLILCGALRTELDLRGILTQCLHLTNYHYIQHYEHGLIPGLGVYWSLAVEEHFYLVFPFVFTLGYGKLGPRKLAIWLLSAALAVLAWRIILVLLLHTPYENRTGVTTDARIDSILWGCILALWRNPALTPGAARSLATGKNCAIALLVLLATLICHNAVFRETFRYTLESLCLIPLFCAAMLRTDWLAVQFLNTRFMRWLGHISYTFYLSHRMFFIVFLQNFPSWPKFVLILATLAATFIFSQAIRVAVELPLARVRKRHSGA
jgi:peptidoglycan/LPS O-acetylase OafA/YrhL